MGRRDVNDFLNKWNDRGTRGGGEGASNDRERERQTQINLDKPRNAVCRF